MVWEMVNGRKRSVSVCVRRQFGFGSCLAEGRRTQQLHFDSCQLESVTTPCATQLGTVQNPKLIFEVHLTSV